MSPATDRAHRTDREVGVVLAITPTGNLTLRAPGSTFPPEGSYVSDRAGHRAGRVLRVFGPVARPYLTIRPTRPPTPSEGAALVGSTLVKERGNQHGQR